MTVVIAAVILAVCVLGFSDIISRREVMESRIAVLEAKAREQEVEKNKRAAARKAFGAGVC